MKTKEVVIVGEGKVCTYLAGRLESLGFGVIFFTRHDNDFKKFEDFLDLVKPEAVFLDTGIKDKGQTAFGYIEICTICSVPIITREKDVLAYYFKELKPILCWIGYSATLGGSTQILEYIQGRFWDDQSVQIYAVLSSSLNFFFEEIAKGRTLEQAYEDAVILEIAEPEEKDPLSFVNRELQDLYTKASVLYNSSLSKGCFITPDAFKVRDLKNDDLKKITEGVEQYRFIVSFLNHKKNDIAGWSIKVAPHKINNNQFYDWLPKGFNNAAYIIEIEDEVSDEFVLSGPGSGIKSTTSAMLADFKRLCNL